MFDVYEIHALYHLPNSQGSPQSSKSLLSTFVLPLRVLDWVLVLWGVCSPGLQQSDFGQWDHPLQGYLNPGGGISKSENILNKKCPLAHMFGNKDTIRILAWIYEISVPGELEKLQAIPEDTWKTKKMSTARFMLPIVKYLPLLIMTVQKLSVILHFAVLLFVVFRKNDLVLDKLCL